MPAYRQPMINLYSSDLPRSLAFYSALGFSETFRTPSNGLPVHVELSLDGFKLGIANADAASQDHGLHPSMGSHSVEIVLWCDDVDVAVLELTGRGAQLLSPAHNFLEGKLRAGWVADPDGHPIQLVQKKSN